MSRFKSSFKKFGGEHISDIIEYLKDYLLKSPTATITVGCDSIQKRRRTVYAITIMMYNTDLRNGTHVIFFRESCDKIRDNQERLYKEAQYLHDVGVYLDEELSNFYEREDLTEIERKRYKFHLAKCNHEYYHVPNHLEEGVMNGMSLAPADRMDFRLVDIHIDFNPNEGTKNERGVSKNKSYIAYKSYVPWLRAMGFRTWAKPSSYASTKAADLLLQD
jgi:predicted RNase H-related nuclease YkuK (DUF458 family)